MKTPEYRLRVVEMLSGLRQKAAMRALAEKNQEAASREREVQEVEAALERARRDLQKARLALSRVGDGSPVDTRTLLMLCRDVESLGTSVATRRREVDRKHRDFRRALDEVERARQALGSAMRAVQALKQHKERWLAEVTTEQRRTEDRKLAEHALTQWARRDGGGTS
ncbi:MAG: hypothetical protein ACRD2Z_13705 [Thermoanaerobaculia bacterium]